MTYPFLRPSRSWRLSGVCASLLCSVTLSLVACGDDDGRPGTEPDGNVTDASGDGSVTDAGGDGGGDGGGCTVSSASSCESLPAITQMPTIDGNMDCGLTLVDVDPQGWMRDGEVPGDISAQYALAWHPQGLYVFVRVEDPTQTPPPSNLPDWCGDAVEIFVDDDGEFSNSPVYDDPGTRQFVVSRPATADASSRRGSVFRDQIPQGSWTNGQFEAFPTSTGYDVEAFITADDLEMANWTLQAAEQLGFNLGVNFAFGTQSGDACDDDLLGQFYLRLGTETDGTCVQYPSCDVRSFCTPTLAAAQ